MARLKEQYVNEIAPALNSKFGVYIKHDQHLILCAQVQSTVQIAFLA